MAIIVEDGTGKIDANSYATVTEARAYATARGVALPDDSKVEAFLTLAMDYLESKKYKGRQTYPDHPQALSWPRTGVYVDCELLPSNKVPRQMKSAQMQLVVEQGSGRSLMPSTDGTVVKRKKVDVLEKEFFSPEELGQSGAPMPSFPMVDALLADLISGRGFSLRTERV